MKLLLSATLLCLAAPVCAGPPAPAELLYQPPPGWKVAAMAGFTYKVSFARPAHKFAANLNTVTEAAPVSLSEYAQKNIAVMKRVFHGFKLFGQAPFVTTAGLHGLRLRARSTIEGHPLRQTFYLFPGPGGHKYIVTLSSLAQDGNRYDVIADTAMKTFAPPAAGGR